MKNMIVRSFKLGDEKQIVELIRSARRKTNIKDYDEELIEELCQEVNEELIIKRAEKFHMYVVEINDKIVGVGAIGLCNGSLTESSFYNIYVLPEYQGKGIGKVIVTTLEKDDYYKRANRIEIASSISAMEFYKHMGYGFKNLGYIVDDEGEYKMEKYPKICYDNSDKKQYNMRPYIDNSYYNYKEFIYQTKKKAYKKYVEKYWGVWDENIQRDFFEEFIKNAEDDAWIIQLNRVDIGFYNGRKLEDGSYEICNICIIPEYQNRGIGNQVLKDIIELHKEQDIHIQYFKDNPVGRLYEKLGFVNSGENEFHYMMVKYKNI